MAHELNGSPPRGACAPSTGPRESTHTCPLIDRAEARRAAERGIRSAAVCTGRGCPQPCAQTQTTRDGGGRADTRTEEPVAPEASDDTEPLDICGTKPLPAGRRDGCLKGFGGEHACAPMGTPVVILMACGRRPPPPPPFAPPSTGGAIRTGPGANG